MKLFYIANVRIPTEKAHGLQIAKMCEAFALQGLEVELIIPKIANPIKEDVFKYYGIKENFKITRIFSFSFLRFEKVNSFLIYVQSIIFAIGVFYHVLFNPKKFGSDCIFYLRDEFAPWLLILLGKKVFLEMHAFKKRFKYYRMFFPRLRGLILITDIAKSDFIQAGIPDKNICVYPDAVDLIQFDTGISREQARRRLNLPLDKKVIAYTGSLFLHSWKGVDILLESARLFSQDYLFVLVGGTEKEIAGIKAQYPSDNTLLIAQRPNKDIPYYLKAADVLILPNKKGDLISERYTSPLKMFEYMASNRPIVASDLSSIREILSDQNSILVEPNDPQKLAEGIKKAVGDQDMSQKISQQAFFDVQTHSWEKRAGSIILFINRCLSS